jgi:hypothetical protein
VSRCAIDGRKSGIGFAEDEVEVCAGENDGFNAIAPAKHPGYIPQFRVVGGCDLPIRGQFKIDAMHRVDLVSTRADDVESAESPNRSLSIVNLVPNNATRERPRA